MGNEALKIDHSELGDFTFTDIEEVYVIAKIKGKNYAIEPKKGNESQAKINRFTALYMILDEHIISLPSISEVVEFKRKLESLNFHIDD